MGLRGIELKKPSQLRTMRKAGLVVARTLTEIGQAVAPGVTTGELDQIAREVLARHGAGSSFLNYGAGWGLPPYPAVTCISVNEEIVHGIPGGRVLQDGDIVSVDFGAHIEGYHGDAARTFLVGEVCEEARSLSDLTRESMWAGFAEFQLGKRIGDISSAIERHIDAQPMANGEAHGIIREYTGHGIGTRMHMDPDVPNWGRAGRGPKLVEGMVLAIEPMVTLGTEETAELDDQWTIVTADGSWASHWENTVTCTRNGLWILTLEDGGEEELTRRGLPFGPLAD